MSAAGFIDAGYLSKVWESLRRDERLDYVKLRSTLEQSYLDRQNGEHIEEGYYFCADANPAGISGNSFYKMLAFPPPTGAGLRVKSYWLKKRTLYWPNRMGGEPVTHPTTGEQYVLTQQKAVDVGLAFHLARSHANRRWEKLLLAAGDADFHEVVQHLVENHNVELTLVGSRDSISDSLMPYAKNIFQLGEHADSLGLPSDPASS